MNKNQKWKGKNYKFQGRGKYTFSIYDQINRYLHSFVKPKVEERKKVFTLLAFLSRYFHESSVFHKYFLLRLDLKVYILSQIFT